MRRLSSLEQTMKKGSPINPSDQWRVGASLPLQSRIPGVAWLAPSKPCGTSSPVRTEARSLDTSKRAESHVKSVTHTCQSLHFAWNRNVGRRTKCGGFPSI